ncbi:FlgE family flagellar hook protein [Buttiauxella ferragutiae ATCC 51602]|jgi:flagellar hook protein FlgE|uniref:Flagellar hook protein FlgE n=1 Tax=Buttiauxella ferragutiae ATCC 51602 TaxID=1354252 RepID=A0ABX2W8W0_9ENTR|nr:MULTISPECIES: flagellar hook protein FlgE [Buttiauxella]OAT28103.1 FlgE family flagellar hook protein [Buttiauxella ferragutiae ATCC 51602]TDN49807.1 flagellar hook protein FlgE [Buttiauxella sp. JUb87]
MSYAISVSGLNAASQSLNTISMDIANSATVGYMESTTTFSALYAGGQAAGVSSGYTTQNFSALGTTTFTGRDLDMAITGDGFFITQGADGQTYYTRAGNFHQDEDGYIVDSNGNRVQGYPVDENGNIMSGQLDDLQLDNGSMPPMETSDVDLGMNLDQNAEIIDRTTTTFDPSDPNSYHSTNSTVVYDSMGNQHTVSQYYTKTADGSWEVQVYMDGQPANGYCTPPGPQTLQFDTDGNLVSGGNFTLDIPLNDPLLQGAGAMSIEVDLTQTTQYAVPFSNQLNSSNGYPAGDQTGVTVDEYGNIYATYSNGETMLQGQVVLATFPNPEALAVADNTSWTQTSTSGQPLYGTPGTGVYGGIESQSLQNSTTDVTGEMVYMMEVQRNYQANTKAIAVQSQLDQVLMQAI